MKRFITTLLAIVLLLSGCHSPQALPTQPESATIAVEQDTEPSTEPVATEPVIPETEPASVHFDPYTIMEAMTTEELVGQLFLAACPTGNSAAEDVVNYHLGGYVLFGYHIEDESPESLVQTIRQYQDAATIPLLIAVDEEGGTVTRVSSHSQFRSERFPSPRSAYDAGGLGNAISIETEKAKLLTGLGINLNLAPVCDITTDPNAFMYKRSLGQDPVTTGQFIAAAVMTMDRNGLGSMLKHFPGYGNNVDTHVGIAVDERSLEQLESNDLVPFRYGMDMGCGAIMISHTIVKCLDEELPASLSPKVVGYIRSTMGYDGVISTDDLIMQAITDRYGDGEAAVMAVNAGVDLLCTSSYRVQYEAVLEAVNDGRISREELTDSVARILRWKNQLGLL